MPEALMIRSPYIERILSGEKTWEIRGTNTKKRGRVGLIMSKSGTVVGSAILKEVVGPLSREEFLQTADKHRDFPEDPDNFEMPYKETYAWVLTDPFEFPSPLPYSHPNGAITWVRLPPGFKMPEPGAKYRFEVPRDDLKSRFLKSFAADLRKLKHQVAYRQTNDSHELSFTPFDDLTLSEEQKQEHYRVLYGELKETLRRRHGKFLKEIEKESLPQLLLPGSEIDPSKIRPEVVVCRNKSQRGLYKYCRLYQGLTDSDGVGRRFGALVMDTGQSRPTLIGAIGLSNVGYSLRSRDDYFGWNEVDIRKIPRTKKGGDSLLTKKAIRDLLDAPKIDGLKRIMQLSVCVALPPYSYLYAGRLLAMLALSDPIQQRCREQKEGKHPPLLALLTTTAYGPYASIFRRLNLTKIPKFELFGGFENVELFRHIGNTDGCTSALISDKTHKLAVELVMSSSKRPKRKQGMHTDSGRHAILQRAASLCGVSNEVFRLNTKGVYVGALHNKNIEALRSGDYREIVTDLPVEPVYSYWRDVWLKKALGKPDLVQLLENHAPRDCFIAPK